MLIETVDSFDRIVRNVLLATIEALNSSDLMLICNEMLFIIQSKAVDADYLEKRFILVTARTLLSTVDLVQVVGKYNSKNISDYRYWLFLDASATLISIYLHLGK